jgi:uncharacterized oligopeptide transporter (OPT) family protein
MKQAWTVQQKCSEASQYGAVVCGLLIGGLVNLSNTYYGLRIGAGSQMSMASGLLGFSALKLLSKHTTGHFTAAENVLVISVATSTGCMPVTAGFVGIIPALEYPITPEENGPLQIAWGSLVVWSLALAFFGLIFASLLRNHFIVRERLPWPGAKATAHLINTLHHAGEDHQRMTTGDFGPQVVLRLQSGRIMIVLLKKPGSPCFCEEIIQSGGLIRAASLRARAYPEFSYDCSTTASRKFWCG